MSKPVLSIIVLSYNTAPITLNCLKSILLDKGLKNTPYEIIVVDNASTDDSVSQISHLRIPNLTLIKNKTNFGFAKANNQALKIAQGNYVLFLNSDTIILHSAISQSLDWLCSNPQAVTCTAQLLNSNKSIQPTGGFFPNLLNFLAWFTRLDDLPLINILIPPIHPHSPQFYTHDQFYLSDRQLDWVTGAFLLTRKSILDQVGGFDQDYFMYGEELELCYRIKKKYPDYQTWYLIGPQIIHLGGASSNKKNAISRERDGMVSFFHKHRPHWQYLLVKTLLRR
ncbi:hypothetical protein A3K55_02760 [Candidatus Shapirobacteria bacterium RBG_13_44_7]|uniref:Glycosyltransferase 2-like domain-containing protein n=1 Tax=Candidatus Shapirobacteria bacterium RBG_13_44_7 TaxID=1802149 RepID=A0A1F7SKS1_9BACT|nr:MAG: hypothetical protein A3K55_02760 [Candidatus Shapirobacteria bacterium RBG_13_44_7]